jgi:hypothetical protein
MSLLVGFLLGVARITLPEEARLGDGPLLGAYAAYLALQSTKAVNGRYEAGALVIGQLRLPGVMAMTQDGVVIIPTPPAPPYLLAVLGISDIGFHLIQRDLPPQLPTGSPLLGQGRDAFVALCLTGSLPF